MQFFKAVNFENIHVLQTEIPNLITREEIDLQDQPESTAHVIEHLKAKTRLYFLGSSKSPQTIKNSTWIFYDVITENGKRGWVFGAPNVVGTINDETVD